MAEMKNASHQNATMKQQAKPMGNSNCWAELMKSELIVHGGEQIDIAALKPPWSAGWSPWATGFYRFSTGPAVRAGGVWTISSDGVQSRVSLAITR